MIVYSGGLDILLHTYGSVLPRTAPYAVVAAGLAVIASEVVVEVEYYIRHPSAYFSSFSFILGFLLVFRSNLAYQRFWEGRTQIAIFMSKLGDVALHTTHFCLGNDEEARQWKRATKSLLLLCHALAMQRLRGERDLASLEAEGLLSPEQAKALENENHRTFVVFSWITHSLSKRHADGGIDVAPPIYSRTFQVLSEAGAAYNNARKIRETPFPFPYVQMVSFFLHIFLLSVPFVIAAYVRTPFAAGALSFVVVWAFFSVNSTASELENPFGYEANDLPLNAFRNEFRYDVFALGPPINMEDIIVPAPLLESQDNANVFNLRLQNANPHNTNGAVMGNTSEADGPAKEVPIQIQIDTNPSAENPEAEGAMRARDAQRHDAHTSQKQLQSQLYEVTTARQRPISISMMRANSEFRHLD